MTILQKILATKEQEIAEFPSTFPKRTVPLVPFFDVDHPKLALIAEIKRASPSKGIINGEIDPVAQAIKYEKAGAKAISVLTDETYFKGTIADMAAVKQAVHTSVLNKDFIISTQQIDRAYAYGADMILLIVAALNDASLHHLYTYARNLQLDVLVETHTAQEFERACALGARIIGINHRDLHDFSVDITRSGAILQNQRFADKMIIAESGIVTQKDVLTLSTYGIDGILVGETLMRAQDAHALAQQLQVPRHAH